MFGQGLNFGGLTGTAALDIDFLIVAGGGGGGPNHGGGGGAGGYKTTTTYSGSETPLVGILGTAYDVTVGPGGAGALAGVNGTSGSNSNFNGIISTGGGGGAKNVTAGTAGGSGGGGSRGNGGGSGITGQGNDGATGTSLSGGGGGGANTAGSTGSSARNGGNGGDGIANSISGTSTPYAGGGGGNGYENTGGTGGTGGGGNGGQYGGSGEYVGTNGTLNTGGGGGGNYANTATFQMRGMNGGSGTVILRYPTSSISSYAVTGTLDTVANTAYPIANTAYYKLNGNANDSSGNGYNGTASNITYAAGRFGNAASFTGVSNGSFINLGNSSIFSPATQGALTFSCWIKTSSGNSGYIASKVNDISASPTYEWAIEHLSNGTLTLVAYNAQASVVASSINNNATIDDGSWHNVVAVIVNGTSTTLYIDGLSATSTSWTGSAATSSAAAVFLGAVGKSDATPPVQPGAAQHYGGLMDQVRFYNSALSAANVISLYNEGKVVESTDGTDSILQFIGGSGDITFS